MKRLLVTLAVGAALLAHPASAATQCEVVNIHGYWEVRADGLQPFGEYFLYVHDQGWTADQLALANGGGVIRFIDSIDPSQRFQIRAADGSLAAHC